jgi:TonB family protein
MLHILLGLLLVQQASGQFSGTVTDVAGKPLRNATIVLTDFQADQRYMTSTDAAGQFQFSQLPIAKYVAGVLSAVQTGYKNQGYGQGHASVTIESGQKTQRDFKLRLIVNTESAQSRPDLYERPERPTYGASTSAAGMEYFLLERVEPANPQHWTGTVTLQAVTDIDGKVISLRVMASDANPDLARAAVEVVSKWVYRPFVILGVAKQVQFSVDVQFSSN